jgi:Flp pilus assembly protein TadG
MKHLINEELRHKLHNKIKTLLTTSALETDSATSLPNKIKLNVSPSWADTQNNRNNNTCTINHKSQREKQIVKNIIEKTN